MKSGQIHEFPGLAGKILIRFSLHRETNGLEHDVSIARVDQSVDEALADLIEGKFTACKISNVRQPEVLEVAFAGVAGMEVTTDVVAQGRGAALDAILLDLDAGAKHKAIVERAKEYVNRKK